ncbi:MAG: orotidine-5'-phosphate decarboxylase [Candidatus Sumerlaeota bacterium]|nr:orotidine-5'-phosphate decarboxylase [Candidatus Sumerlaeota bacterium]
MNSNGKDSRIILALDVPSLGSAEQLMDAVGGEIGYVKIGLEAINAQIASQIAKSATARGYQIFWDCKLDDTPHTIGAASRVISALNVWAFNVHACADVEGLMAAVVNQGSAMVLAVTALTSMNTETVELVAGRSRNATVLYRARMAAYAGCGGIVCSPKELDFLAGFYGPKATVPEKQLERLVKVIPGTRSAGVSADDQKNVDTVENTIRNGAHLVVIGREISKNSKGLSPADADNDLNERIARTLESMRT